MSDPTARSARSIQSVVRTTVSVSFLTELEGSGDILTGHSAGFNPRILLFSDDGRLKRSLTSSNISLFNPLDAVALPGGGAALLGRRAKEVQIVLLDNDLNIVDQFAYAVDAILHNSLRIATDGQFAYVLGEHYASSAWELALTAIRLDTGALE